MHPVTHQTIKLSRGKHASPEEGACVIELASMLAGEPFSDHPRSVCPVVAAVLRRYNDALDDRRRQDLYAYASKVVGSRGSIRLERARSEHLRQWVSERTPRHWPRWFAPAYALRAIEPSVDTLARRAVHKIWRHDHDGHRLMLALVDELLALDPRQRAMGQPLLTEPAGRSRESLCPGPAVR
jgi:hypothetical protein